MTEEATTIRATDAAGPPDGAELARTAEASLNTRVAAACSGFLALAWDAGAPTAHVHSLMRDAASRGACGCRLHVADFAPEGGNFSLFSLAAVRGAAEGALADVTAWARSAGIDPALRVELIGEGSAARLRLTLHLQWSGGPAAPGRNR